MAIRLASFDGTIAWNAAGKVQVVKGMRIGAELAYPTTRSLPPAENHRSGGFQPGLGTQ